MIKVHVPRCESNSLADAQPGTGQQTDHGGEGRGPKGTTRANLLGALDQGGELRGSKEVGVGATEGRYQATIRHLGVWNHRPEVGEKASCHAQALGGSACAPLG